MGLYSNVSRRRLQNWLSDRPCHSMKFQDERISSRRIFELLSSKNLGIFGWKTISFCNCIKVSYVVDREKSENAWSQKLHHALVEGQLGSTFVWSRDAL